MKLLVPSYLKYSKHIFKHLEINVSNFFFPSYL